MNLKRLGAMLADPVPTLVDFGLRSLPQKSMSDGNSGEWPTLVWPSNHGTPEYTGWEEFFLSAFRGHAHTTKQELTPSKKGAVVAQFDNGRGDVVNVAFDCGDLRETIDEFALDSSSIYFKCQFSETGYADPRIVPGGYTSSSSRYLYKYLPYLRRLASKPKVHGVYGRFGMAYNAAQRSRAIELLAEADKTSNPIGYYESGYVRQFRMLVNMARSKISVHMPGKGDFCYRLVDSFAMGACVIGPRPRNILPEPLVNGEHMIFCKDDLSDLVDLCRRYINDDAERTRIARNARDYFDRVLHRQALGRYYVERINQVCRRETIAN